MCKLQYLKYVQIFYIFVFQSRESEIFYLVPNLFRDILNIVILELQF